ncbi:PIG-L deacetylase family protein [Streptomyces sp. NPDC091292]|uniref:PIG-L deacetylase family protein n=1 Tax=Streptomyces sp. NPDC091292 TaxID=3365991 RepID=UPI00381C3F9F
MPVPSLLAVFAHPDDESLSAGGVLARHAAAGACTGVTTSTWAEGTPRAAELAEALRILGAGEPRMLGYADARVPHSAPGCARFCDAPLDEAVRRLVAHIREFRPEIVVTHDGYGGLTGHPDHVHTHRVTVLAAEAAGLERLHPDAGPPWHPRALYLATHPRSAVPALRDLIGERKAVYSVPDEHVTATVDVTPWMEQKIAAVLAHRSEVARGALPGLIAGLPPEERRRLFATEWYIRHSPVHAAGAGTEAEAVPGTAAGALPQTALTV